MQLLFGIPETETKKVEKVQKTAARWVCRRWHNKSSVTVDDMLNDLDWPSPEDRRLKSSLTFFYKIHSGTVSLDKDKYLTPAPRLRSTRASHDSQYCNDFHPCRIPENASDIRLVLTLSVMKCYTE